jgi:hypothetical protein
LSVSVVLLVPVVILVSGRFSPLRFFQSRGYSASYTIRPLNIQSPQSFSSAQSSGFRCTHITPHTLPTSTVGSPTTSSRTRRSMSACSYANGSSRSYCTHGRRCGQSQPQCHQASARRRPTCETTFIVVSGQRRQARSLSRQRGGCIITRLYNIITACMHHSAKLHDPGWEPRRDEKIPTTQPMLKCDPSFHSFAAAGASATPLGVVPVDRLMTHSPTSKATSAGVGSSSL